MDNTKKQKNNKTSTVIARVTDDERNYLAQLNPCLSKAIRHCIQYHNRYNGEFFSSRAGTSVERAEKAIKWNDKITSTKGYRLLRESLRKNNE